MSSLNNVFLKPVNYLFFVSVGLLAYRYFLTQELGLHNDEAINLIRSQASWSDLLRQPNFDHPQILYIILKGSVNFFQSSSELVLRAHNLILATFLPLLFYKFFLSFGVEQKMALILSIVNCMNPIIIKMQVYGTNYVLVISFLLLSFICINSDNLRYKNSKILLSALFFILAFFSHYSAILYLPTLFLLVITRKPPLSLRFWTSLLLLSLGVFYLWYPQFVVLMESLNFRFLSFDGSKWWHFVKQVNQKMSPLYFTSKHIIGAHFILWTLFLKIGHRKGLISCALISPLVIVGLFSTNHFLSARYSPLFLTFILLMVGMLIKSKQSINNFIFCALLYLLCISPQWLWFNNHSSVPFRSFAQERLHTLDKNTTIATMNYLAPVAKYYFPNHNVIPVEEITTHKGLPTNTLIFLTARLFVNGKLKLPLTKDENLNRSLNSIVWDQFEATFPNYLKIRYFHLKNEYD